MADREVKVLKKTKTNLKRTLTKILTYFENADEDTSIYDINVRLDSINKLKDDFSQNISQLELLDEAGEYETEIDEVEDKIFVALALGQKLPDSKAARGNEGNVLEAAKPKASSAVRLPELALPVFNGEYECWYTFKDTFTALIHNNASLTNIQRYYYLNSCLKGPASKLLGTLEINSNNYSVAWDLLKNRFENEKLIVNSHIDALIDLPGLSKESYNGLRNLIDEFTKHKAALEMLHEPVKSWDAMLVRLLARKLDTTTRKAWESAQHTTKLPSLKEILEFLNNRCRVLETMYSKNVTSEKTKTAVSSTVATNKKCTMCGGEHLIYTCSNFTKLSVIDRKTKARELGLCLNCLRKNHIARDCRANKCSLCHQLHNRLLHIPGNKSDDNTKKEESQEVVSSHCRAYTTHVLLSTAFVMVEAADGKYRKMRALLDVGSDTNFITKGAYELLGLDNTKQVNINIRGICMSTSKTNLQTRLKFKSLVSNFNAELDFLLVDVITSKIPLVKLNTEGLNIPKQIKLADVNFDTPGDIQLLLGAEIFYNLMKGGNIQLGHKKPILRNSHLGWLVTGTIKSDLKEENRICQLSINQKHNDLQSQLEKFWETEEIEVSRHQSASEEECEKSFINNFQRAEDGRFSVYLPIKEKADLGCSKELARKRFYSLEKRLNKNAEIKEQYSEFMDDYVRLGHMELVKGDNAEESRDSKRLIYYIPHHHVLKESSSTTKLRVVFDASAQTTNGKSLNDILHVGPYIQSELLDILLRFRRHNVVITGDIEKMYRQIWIDDKYTDLQRIFWRKNSTDPLLEYKLKTVAYGTAPASFLATRVLKQLAIENGHDYPDASKSIELDFYMDDWIAGGESEEAVIKLKNDVVHILKAAGLNLRKFGSNSERVLASCFENNTDKYVLRNMTEERTLGIQWDAAADNLRYELTFEISTETSKRAVLGVIAKIFDPLGLVSPIIIRAKMFLQKLWLANLGWNDNLPQELFLEWKNIKLDLSKLNSYIIPRRVLLENYETLEIHGFSDASEKAYGCVIYLKSIGSNGEVKVALLCSKSKVSPVKNVTLPRLELCGAVLLVNLMKRIRNTVNTGDQNVHFWTDSSVVLNWINTEPCKLKTFVANRISKVQANTSNYRWHHVKGTENPADIVSRGTTVERLINSIWLKGPTWLEKLESYEPFNKSTKIADQTEFKICQHITRDEINSKLLTRFSNFSTMVRVMAYCKRFAYNCSHKVKRVKLLNRVELCESAENIIRLVQSECFSSELNDLQKSRNIALKSPLIRLNCYLDQKGLIRVGGRLEKADINFESKHPVVLPRKHFVTNLIVRSEHERLLHAGPQLTLSNLRQKYWPIGGRDLVRKIIRQCMVCFRAKPTVCTPMMGNLPIERVNPSRPFSVLGVDYCGHFLIKNSHIRNRILIKAYVSVFVCFATRAVHLELVTSLDKEHFLSALKRFIARRGIPVKIVSDNGTNFVGAVNEIKAIKQELSKLNNDEAFQAYLAEHNIEWSMIPARSSHFGGLHEAAVKSAKSHLKKVASTANMTYESFATVLCQIEGILNSRPLIPLTEDPDDINVLTPGHFLITQPLTALPERNYEDVPTPRLSAYQRQQQIVQNFWRKWQRDYLHILQERWKWCRPTANVAVGDLVLLKEDNLPSQQWRLARIVETHPGDDAVVRVVTLKTKTGQTQRAVHKICPLPKEDLEIEDKPSMAGRMSGRRQRFEIATQTFGLMGAPAGASEEYECARAVDQPA